MERTECECAGPREEHSRLSALEHWNLSSMEYMIFDDIQPKVWHVKEGTKQEETSAFKAEVFQGVTFGQRSIWKKHVPNDPTVPTVSSTPYISSHTPGYICTHRALHRNMASPSVQAPLSFLNCYRPLSELKFHSEFCFYHWVFSKTLSCLTL